MCMDKREYPLTNAMLPHPFPPVRTLVDTPAFDLLVGRGIILDSLSSPSGFSLLFHIFAVVPCLFLTLMAGPVGFALYIGLRMLRPAGGKGHVE